MGGTFSESGGPAESTHGHGPARAYMSWGEAENGQILREIYGLSHGVRAMAKNKAGRGHQSCQWGCSTLGWFKKASLKRCHQQIPGGSKRVMWTLEGKAFQGKGTANTKTLSTWEQKRRLYVFPNNTVSICKYLAPCWHLINSSPPHPIPLTLTLSFFLS